MKNRIKRLLYLAFLMGFLSFCLLGAGGFLAPWLPVGVLPEVQFIPLLFPAFSVCFLGFAFLFLLLRRFRLMALSLLMLALCSAVMMRDIRLFGRQETPAEKDLKVISYNVAAFSFNPLKVQHVASLLAREKPDIVCLQEFRNVEMEDHSFALEYIAEKLGLTHYSFVHLPIHIHGGVIFSRYPILETDTLYLPEEEINSGILLTLNTPKGPLGIANVHLSSYHLLEIVRDRPERLDEAFAFRSKIGDVLTRQQDRMDRILARAKTYPHPLIIAGDFNAVSHSRIISQMSSLFSDSFEAGRGRGWTFPVRSRWGLRIDYQFFSPPLKALQHHILRGGKSDHLPIVVSYR